MATPHKYAVKDLVQVLRSNGSWSDGVVVELRDGAVIVGMEANGHQSGEKIVYLHNFKVVSQVDIPTHLRPAPKEFAINEVVSISRSTGKWSDAVVHAIGSDGSIEVQVMGEEGAARVIPKSEVSYSLRAKVQGSLQPAETMYDAGYPGAASRDATGADKLPTRTVELSPKHALAAVQASGVRAAVQDFAIGEVVSVFRSSGGWSDAVVHSIGSDGSVEVRISGQEGAMKRIPKEATAAHLRRTSCGTSLAKEQAPPQAVEAVHLNPVADDAKKEGSPSEQFAKMHSPLKTVEFSQHPTPAAMQAQETQVLSPKAAQAVLQAAQGLSSTAAQVQIDAQSRDIAFHFGMSGNDISDAGTTYQPLASFVDRPPSVLKSCKEHVFDMLPMLSGVQHLDSVLQEAANTTATKADMKEAKLIGNMSMVFAIVLFTMDVSSVLPGAHEKESNFYYIFNEQLRRRKPQFLAIAHGYLYFLMTGLSKLPPASGYVFRGIDAEKAEAARAKFKRGSRHHWSAFSSATVSSGTAMEFAGDGGIVFRIGLLDTGSRARDIRNLSAFVCESEILLFPNFKMMCTGVSKEGGIDFIDLQEEEVTRIEIDY